MKLTDISISRNHAIFKLYNNELYLIDNKSKYGSLANLNHDIQILPYKNLGLQFGKLFLTFELKRTLFAWFRCYNNMELAGKSYNDFIVSRYVKAEVAENVGIVILPNIDKDCNRVQL